LDTQSQVISPAFTCLI